MIKKMIFISLIIFSGSLLAFSWNFHLFSKKNLVINGTFDSNITNWNTATGSGGSASWSSGTFLITQSDPAPLYYQAIQTKIGARYKMQTDLISGNDFQIQAHSNLPIAYNAVPDLGSFYSYAPATLSLIFIATTNISYIGLKSGGGSTGRTMKIDNVTLVETSGIVGWI